MLIIGLASMVLTSCQKQEDVSEVTEPAKTYVLADLALSLPASTAPRTRMTTDVTQSNGVFRGIQRLSIIPFTKQGKITSTDMPSYYESDPIVSTSWTVPEDRVHHYQKVHLMKGVASFLTYGQAAAVTGEKDIDGSLIPKVEGQSQTAGIMPERMAVSPANLTFELEKIYNKEQIPAGATAIADYLTHIARAEGWKDANDAWLQLLYMNFINQNDQKTNILPGSARNVKAFVTTLYRRLAAMNYNDGTIEKAIVNDIMDRIKNYTGVTCEGEGDALKVTSLGTYDSYPNNLDLPDGAAAVHLPDGAAAVLWDMTAEENQRAFVPQTVTTLDAPINTINRFAYPPELYYYSNSRIKTSNTEIQDYGTDQSWSDVLANLYLYDDAVVSGDTKAVAIKEPLQYGVAHLSATIASTSSSLRDADGNLIDVEYQSKPSFPVTGIIICGQRPVDFEFKVKTTATATGGATGDELFIYDRHFGGSPYLKFGDPASGPFETLALQNEDGKDVTIMLELENQSGKNFKGEDGIVYNGTKFYLTGIIKLSESSNKSEKEDVNKRVFTQDHTTTVKMTVQTLAHAYNVMPNILSGRLEIGVDIKLDWVGTTPTTVILTGDETTNGN